jgi:hypothetical protein
MKLAFVDHSFHRKSSATKFLAELFRERYHVDIFWDESWQGGSRVDIKTINEESYNVIVFFQLIDYPLADIRRLECQNVVFIPMYDGARTLSNSEWLTLSDYRFINFSSTLHIKLERLGLVSLSVQYFLDPTEFEAVDDFGSLRGFFWQRTEGITWTHVRRLLGANEFKEFHIHSAVDPHGYTFVQPSDEERMKYSITISDWYEDRKEYLDALQTANVYFAPRLYEGIGMSFIEAMTMGKCVVAVDHPTMNEYVDNGVNGYLYDLRRAQSLDLSTVREMGKKARESCSLGFKRWVAARDMILEFVSARNCGVENRARTFAGFAARTVFYPVQFLKKVRNVVNRIVMKCST